MRLVLIIPAIAVFLFFLFGCGNTHSAFISQEEMELLSDMHDDLVILDVREHFELSGPLGKIEGAINIPLGQLKDEITGLHPDRDTAIVIYCRTRNRSRAAYEELGRMGYTRLYVLLGGMTDYDHGGQFPGDK